jgi:hypothetical protein
MSNAVLDALVLTGSLMIAVSAGSAPGAAVGADGAGDSPSQVFERLKGLAGHWQGSDAEGTTYGVAFAVTAGGNTVMQTEFPGTDHEMVTLFYLADGALVARHYCMLGNQPRYRYRPTGDANVVVLDFDGGDNLDVDRDAHAHSGTITIVDSDTLESRWSFWRGGKEVDQQIFALRRSR